MPTFAPVDLTRWTGGRWTVQPVVASTGKTGEFAVGGGTMGFGKPVVASTGKIGELAIGGGTIGLGKPIVALSGFTIDSRAVRPGQIFVAIKTDRRDGHEFLAAAEAAGASAAIVATANPALALPQLVVADPTAAFQAIAREHRRAFRGPVIGISGSAGKTSTKELLTLVLGGTGAGVPGAGGNLIKASNASGSSIAHPVLATEGNLNKASIGSGAPIAHAVLATEGNLNNHLGVPLTLTRIDPAIHGFAVIEAGISAPGEMAPLAGMIQPDVALITMIGPAHTLALGGLEEVAREKSGLVRGVKAGGVAVFPKSCTQFAAFRDLFVDQLVLERSAVLRPATLPQHSIHYHVIQRRDETVIAVAFGPPPPARFTLRRITDGMADNAAMAIVVALRLGVDRAVIRARLAGWTAPKLRGEIRREGGRLLYLDCYNANPASMADALATFVAVTEPADRRLYVLGCMEELGAEAPAHHRRLGRTLPLRDGDRLFVIGTQADEVCRGVLEQGDFSKQIQICSTLEPMAAAIAAWRGAVFVKGSRRYQLEQALAGAAREVAYAH